MVLGDSVPLFDCKTVFGVERVVVVLGHDTVVVGFVVVGREVIVEGTLVYVYVPDKRMVVGCLVLPVVERQQA
jgi:hypothetical protein